MSLPLLMTPEIEEAIKAVAVHAEAHPMTSEQMENGPAPGDDPAYVVDIPFGFRAVFTVDEQPDGRRYRHLSLSVARLNRCPHPAAIEMLMPHFGMKRKLAECHVYLEQPIDSQPEFTAVNIIEAMEP